MLRFMRTLEFYYPSLVKVVQVGRSHEGRPIEGVRIGYSGGGGVARNASGAQQRRRAFWLDGNMHAREWASSHTALFVANQLVAGYGRDPRITHYLNTLDFVVVPCTNPDGYEYTRSSLKPQVNSSE